MLLSYDTTMVYYVKLVITFKSSMRACVVGGGTGSSAVLNGLSNYADIDLSVIVGMADDGGSNAVLRDEFGLLPLSDVRKSIIALSDKEDSSLLRQLFTYRFCEGDGLRGHTLGNLMMTAMSRITGSESEAVDKMSSLFSAKGNIYPVTFEEHKLVANYDDGREVVGEHLIDEPDGDLNSKIISLKTDRVVKADQRAIEAILSSDFVILGPGDIYTTTLANIVIDGIPKALQETNAKIFFVTNIMSKAGQTKHRTHKEVNEIVENFVGRKFDRIIMNSQSPSKEVLKYYRINKEHLIKDDVHEDPRVIREHLISDTVFENENGDDLVRSLVRHDSVKLGWTLYKTMKEMMIGSDN